MTATIQDRVNSAEIIDIWGEPKAIESGLYPVEPFRDGLLPKPLRAWVNDIAKCMQVPADFVAVTAMVSAGAVLGNKILICPQRYTDWRVAANLWGCIIGRPGVMKSPAMKQAHGPIYRLQKQADSDFKNARADFDFRTFEREIRKKTARDEITKKLKSNPAMDVSDLLPKDDEEPSAKRYISNDTSYEALAELLRNNENGMLVLRDELTSLLTSLGREDASSARGFYLTGWDGMESYTVDRIGRGLNMQVPKVTISMMGSTQPGKIRKFIASAIEGGDGDDGLIQRFQMMVWPDMSGEWIDYDVPIDRVARDEAYAAFNYLHELTPPMASAHVDEYDEGQGYLRFDDAALLEFQLWRSELEARLRSDELHPSMESHLSKYRKLVPAIALIYHLASGNSGSVGEASVKAAVGWAGYLESHAMRAYGAALDQPAIAAKTLCHKIKKGELGREFSIREVYRKKWTGLTDEKSVRDALEVLEENGWVRVLPVSTTPAGGRPTERFLVNPKVLA